VDRAAIVQAQRRRLALEALEFERSRADALRERLESIVVELEGTAVDEDAIARLSSEDAAIVRVALGGETFAPLEPESDEDRAAQVEAVEEEIVRLQEELAASARAQQALERYLDALRG